MFGVLVCALNFNPKKERFKGKPFGDGEQTRDFIHVSDVMKAIEKALELEAEGVYNIGGGRPVSINSLAETMIRIAGLDLKPEYAPPRLGEIRQSYANINKATLKLEWKPETRLEDGLKQLINSNSTREMT